MLELTSSTFSLSRSSHYRLCYQSHDRGYIREDEYNLIKRFSTRIQGLVSWLLETDGSCILVLWVRLSLIVDTTLEPEGTLGLEIKYKRSSKQIVYATGLMMSRNLVLPNIGNLSSLQQLLVAPPPNPAAKSSSFSCLPLRSSKSSSSGKEAASARDVQSVADVSLQCIPIHVFVFNDLVLLAQSKSPSNDDPLWVLIRDAGVINQTFVHCSYQRSEP